MTLGFIVLAALGDAVKESKRSFERAFSANEMLLIALLGGGIGLVILIWAIFFRKRADEVKHPVPERRRPESDENEDDDDGRVRRRRRRRRRPHRPRNATLSETGGLPPPRPEDEPPPY
jgi:hypothetical protein